MSESRVLVQCPLCRALVRVPRAGRTVRLSCNSGHVFLHTFESHHARRLTTRQFVTLMGVLLALFALVFTRPWVGRRLGSAANAVAGDRAPAR
jgi:hypothetical protein